MKAVKEMGQRVLDTWADFRSEIELPKVLIDAIDDQMGRVPVLVKKRGPK